MLWTGPGPHAVISLRALLIAGAIALAGAWAMRPLFPFLGF